MHYAHNTQTSFHGLVPVIAEVGSEADFDSEVMRSEWHEATALEVATYEAYWYGQGEDGNPFLARYFEALHEPHPDDTEDKLTLWLFYLETGNHDVSWERTDIDEAWGYLTRLYAAREGKPYPSDAPGPAYADGEEEPTPTGYQLVVWVESPLTGEDEFKLLTALGGVVQATGERSRDVTVRYEVEEVRV